MCCMAIWRPNWTTFTITDCYRAIERDYNLDQRVVRDTIRVTGLVKCQEACTDSRLFPCRSFAFSSSLSSSYNCYLSDRSVSELDDRYDLVKDFDSVVYEKRDFCYDNRGRSDGKNATLLLGTYSHGKWLFYNTKKALRKRVSQKMHLAATGLLGKTELVAVNSWDMYLTFLEKRFFKILKNRATRIKNLKTGFFTL